LSSPKTVIGWHRAGCRLRFRWRSRRRRGRPRIPEEFRELIRRLADENGGWGAPEIHGEILKLGSRSRTELWHAICGGRSVTAIRVTAADVLAESPGSDLRFRFLYGYMNYHHEDRVPRCGDERYPKPPASPGKASSTTKGNLDSAIGRTTSYDMFGKMQPED